MPESHTYDFCIPEAQRLADLHGVKYDLFAVQRLCLTFLSLPDDHREKASWIRHAICIAALTRYFRTVGTGVRHGVPKAALDALLDAHKEAHDRLKDIRDKWAAHSVNGFEETVVKIQAAKDDLGAIRARSIAMEHQNTLILSQKDMLELHGLAQALESALDPVIAHEQDVLLAHAVKMDISVLATDPDVFARPNNSDNPQRPRKRYGS